MSIQLIETGRNGALTKYRVTNVAHLADDFPGAGYSFRIDGDDIVGSGNKAGIRSLSNWVDRQNAAPVIRQSNTGRVLVPAGKYAAGDTISGRTISGLGRDFYPNVDQFSVAGVSPDYTGTVQYAYFN